MRDQVGIDLDGFPLDHEFPYDYGLEEEDKCDIEVWSPCSRTSSPTKPPVLSRSARASARRRTRWPRTSFFASVGKTLDKTPRRAPSKSIQPFGFVSTESFMSARSFRLTNLASRPAP
ncbi:hypothetical protein VPH35_140263 [Triticum aestivum]